MTVATVFDRPSPLPPALNQPARSRLTDQGKIKEAVVSILEAIGEDPSREGLVDTPKRMAAMYAEFFSGLGHDPAEPLATGFDESHRELVVLRDIPFFSMCEHHLLPFFGTADVGYVPNGRIVGVSKLARALDILARRPQLQERLTTQLADTILRALEPEGVAVVLRAEHMCMSLRGVRKPGSKIVTSASRGALRTRDATRQEFFAMLKGG